jgi:hypothetical protein
VSQRARTSGGNADTATDWEQRALQAEAALEEALAERNRLWEELHGRDAQARELEHYRAEILRMEASLSWRLTAPLRAAKRLAMKLGAALERAQGSHRR